MSLVEMQSALARLYVDGPFLNQFRADPSTVAERYHLTDREAAALVGIDREALEKFAGSLRVKTWGRFRVPYRLLIALDKATIYKYFLRFYELRPIRPNEAFYRPTLELGDFFERSFRNNSELPPYASELARYERLFFRARFKPRNGEGEWADNEGEAEPSLSSATRLALQPGVELAWFDYEMRAIEKDLNAGKVPQAVEREDCCIVFQSFPTVGRARKFRVAAGTARLLSLCDGVHDLAALAAIMETDSQTLVEASRKLVELRVVATGEIP